MKEKFSCSIDSAGGRVDFNSSVDLFDLFSNKNYTKYVPEIIVSRKPCNNGYKVHYNESNKNTINFQEKEIKISYPWDMMREGEALVYAAYPFIEQQHQANQRATIHASCVEVNKQGILFLGESGSGKTTLAIKLCHQYGAKLFSNDLAVVGLDKDQLYCSGGTKFFNLRRESVARSLPNHLSLFPDSKQDSWSHKIVVKPKDIDIKVGKGRTPLKHIFKVHVDETKKDLTSQYTDNLQTKLSLNENFTRYIRNTVTVVILGKNNEIVASFPSMDKPEFSTWRQKTINDIIIKKYKAQYLSGSSDKMVDLIIRKCHQ
jgi:hypothetical protein